MYKRSRLSNVFSARDMKCADTCMPDGVITQVADSTDQDNYIHRFQQAWHTLNHCDIDNPTYSTGTKAPQPMPSSMSVHLNCKVRLKCRTSASSKTIETTSHEDDLHHCQQHQQRHLPYDTSVSTALLTSLPKSSRSARQVYDEEPETPRAGSGHTCFANETCMGTREAEPFVPNFRVKTR